MVEPQTKHAQHGKSFIANAATLQSGSEKLIENISEVGHITHFFSKINVAVVELTSALSVGDHILVKGPTTDFEQNVDSMQIERQNIPSAQAGQSIGLKMAQPVKERDVVYRKL